MCDMGQHISNYPIHECFGDFYVNLGDSRVLMMEAAIAKKGRRGRAINTSRPDHHIPVDNIPEDYEKALDEYGQVGDWVFQPCPCKEHHQISQRTIKKGLQKPFLGFIY
jgi:hypothetical protein